MRFWLSDSDLTSATISFFSALYLRSWAGDSDSFLSLFSTLLVLQPAQLLVGVGDAVEGLQHLGLELGLHRGKRDRVLQIVVVVEAVGRGRRRALEALGRSLRRGGGGDAFADLRGQRLRGAGRGHVDLRRLLAVRAGVGRFEIDDVAQQNLGVVQFVAPDDDGLEGQRAFAQARDHRLAARLDALGDGDFALARKQLDRAHFAQVHAHGIVGALDRFGAARRHRRGARRLDEFVPSASLFDGLGGGLGGLLFRLFGVLGVDDVDAHFAEHRIHVLDLIGGNLLGRQHRVQFFLGDPAALLGDLDHPLDRGVGQVEQRAVRGFYDHRFAFGLRLVVPCHIGVSKEVRARRGRSIQPRPPSGRRPFKPKCARLPGSRGASAVRTAAPEDRSPPLTLR